MQTTPEGRRGFASAAVETDPRAAKLREVVVTGAGLCEAAMPATAFVPRLNNALEQELYARARRKTAIEEWRVRSFHADDFAGQSRSPLINPHLRAQELAFAEALRSAGLLRKIGRKQSRRVGVIYVDFYGNTSSLERELSSRELYYLDVYPTYLLQNHNISGFSMKTRGERNGAIEAFDVAQTLIRSGELDAVILGGVFPVYSYLFLSEALEDAAWIKARGLRERGGVCELRERSVFIVLEGADAAGDRGQKARFHIGDPEHYRVPEAHLANFWADRWRIQKQATASDTASGEMAAEGPARRRDPSRLFGGVYRAAATDAEFSALAGRFPDAMAVDLSADGDSGHLNALKPFVARARTSVDGTASPSPEPAPQAGGRTRQALIHTCDRSGCGSELWIEQTKDNLNG
ncbi:MAG: hypothetical protein RIF32_05215 [Leptospirales bacterium]